MVNVALVFLGLLVGVALALALAALIYLLVATRSGGINPLPPCSVTHASSLPSASGKCCSTAPSLWVVPVGASATPFLASIHPVSYTSVCASLCSKIVPESGGTVKCLGPGGTGTSGGTGADLTPQYLDCLQALQPTACHGVALPVAVADHSLLYAARLATPAEVSHCTMKC